MESNSRQWQLSCRLTNGTHCFWQRAESYKWQSLADVVRTLKGAAAHNPYCARVLRTVCLTFIAHSPFFGNFSLRAPNVFLMLHSCMLNLIIFRSPLHLISEQHSAEKKLIKLRLLRLAPADNPKIYCVDFRGH